MKATANKFRCIGRQLAAKAYHAHTASCKTVPEARNREATANKFRCIGRQLAAKAYHAYGELQDGVRGAKFGSR